MIQRNRRTPSQGFLCPICNTKSVDARVDLIVNKKRLETFDSALKAEDYFLDSGFGTGFIQHIYVCKKCGFEEMKHERLVTKPK